MPATLDKHETAILSRALASENGNLSREAAESILRIQLSQADQAELRRLSQLAAEGTLSEAEEVELESRAIAGTAEVEGPYLAQSAGRLRR